MSSHHFVKENQEPALLILDPLTVSRSTIEGLLEWNPTVIIETSGWKSIKNWGIKVDIILVKENILTDDFKAKLYQQVPIKILTYAETESSLTYAFHLLNAGNYKGVNIISDQHQFDAITTIAQTFLSHLEVVIYHQQGKTFWIKNGSFEKWARRDQRFYLNPQEDHHSIITTGLILEKQGAISQFNAKEEGKISIAQSHSFWLTEEI